MSSVSEKLASLHYAAWNLVILLLWFGWGLLMAGSDALTKDFEGMNNVLIRDWLLSGESNFPILKIWFIGLCLLMILMGINLIFCSWEKIFRIIRAKFNGPKLFMLIIHAIFGIVALCHLGGFMLGYEHNNIELGEGKTYTFEDGYEIEVAKINFIHDYKVLEKKRKYITKDDFDYKKNFAEIALNRNGKEVSRGKIFYLNPMVYKDIQVTLRSFMLSPEKGGFEGGVDQKPWIILTVSRNPVLKIFLALYPIMIAGIFIYLLMTWQTRPKNGFNEK